MTELYPELKIETLSLLYPPGVEPDEVLQKIENQTAEDLGLQDILKVMEFPRARYQKPPDWRICKDKETLEWRQQILEDLQRHDQLSKAVKNLQPLAGQLSYYLYHPGKQDATPLQEIAWRLRELENYIICVETLKEVFQSSRTFRSHGLNLLKEMVLKIRHEEGYIQLKKEIPRLLKGLNSIRSLTVGINLNKGLIPVEAVVLSVEDKPFKDPGVLNRLVSKEKQEPLGKLHSARGTEYEADPMLNSLYRELSEILDKSFKPVQKALFRFGKISGRVFLKLLQDFQFYLGAIQLIEKMEKLGVPMCAPVLHSKSTGTQRIKGMVNLHLALRKNSAKELVPNDLELTSDRRITLITGPNSGGKTCFLQAVGLVQILAQWGLPVPAESADMELCDNVLTHYPLLEDLYKDSGRMGEEADRLRHILSKGTKHTLFLLNETLSSTNMSEAVFLAEDMLKVFRQMGGIFFYATHMHQLAHTGNQYTQCLVAEMKEHNRSLQPSYRIRPGIPQGSSYAAELALKHGIDYDSLLLLTEASMTEPLVP